MTAASSPQEAGAPRGHDVIEYALKQAAKVCRYHGTDWDKLGREPYREPAGQPPRCDSCKQPWRVQQALAALASREAEVRRKVADEIEQWARPWRETFPEEVWAAVDHLLIDLRQRGMPA